MNQQWDWGVFLRTYSGKDTYGQWLLSAWSWTLAVSGAALVLALALGVLVGVARTTPVKALRVAGDAWTELFRNVPLLVQVFVWYHVVPAILPSFQRVSSFWLVVLALALYTSARVSEQIRAGIESLPRGQRNAALALGLTQVQTYHHVLLPMALRIVIPPLTSESMNIVKNSSIAFAVSIPELTMFAMQAQEETSRGVEIYLAVTAAYFVSAFAVNRVAAVIERRLRVPGMSGTQAEGRTR